MTVLKKLSVNFLPLVIALTVLCALFLPFSSANLWWREFFNSGHTFLFFFVAYALYSVLSVKPFFLHSVKTYLTVLFIGLLLGVAVEIMQGLSQREASVEDLYGDFFGIVAGLLFVTQTRQKRLFKKIILIILTASFLLVGAAPLLKISWHYFQRDKAFPAITALDKKWFSSFVRLNNSQRLTSAEIDNENPFLHTMRFSPGKYPGVVIIEPQKNWSGYRQLRFKIYSENELVNKLVIRVHDVKHNQKLSDRFNQQINLKPGLNEIVIDLAEIRDAPIQRKIDLANIAGVELFLTSTSVPIILRISDLLLAK